MQTSERQADRPSTEVSISEYGLHKVSISENPSTKVVWKTLVHKVSIRFYV